MKISETKAEGLLREYSILITAAEIDEQVSAKLTELAATVNMPGFRPGKVPMSVVKSRFGPQVQGEALKNALDEGARQAIEDNELRLASQPSVDIKAHKEHQVGRAAEGVVGGDHLNPVGSRRLMRDIGGGTDVFENVNERRSFVWERKSH